MKKYYYYLYIIIDKYNNNKYYIGQRKSLKPPLEDTKYMGSGTLIKRAISRAIRPDLQFEKRILKEYPDAESLNTAEINIIASKKVQDDILFMRCYNLMEGGRANINRRLKKNKKEVPKAFIVDRSMNVMTIEECHKMADELHEETLKEWHLKN